ncbi:hypothetical protein FRC17_004011 [Serendipita sp. 399]|nr:hypothetical protein FRC17_004011 [Serendipita sp. 399]
MARVLKEVVCLNGQWSTEYLQLGICANELLRGQRRFDLTISEVDTTFQRKGKQPSKSKNQNKGKGKVTAAINRNTRVDPIFVDDEDDSNGENAIEYSGPYDDDEIEYVPPNIESRRVPLPPTKDDRYSPEVITIEDDDEEKPVVNKLHKSLLKLRKDLARAKRKEESNIMSDECIHMLALTRPNDVSEFTETLRDVYGEERIVDDIIRRYGLKFLHLCIVDASEGGSKSTSKPQSAKTSAPPSKQEMRSKYSFVPEKGRGKRTAVTTKQISGIREMDV